MTAKTRPDLGQPELERLAREWFRDELAALERRLSAKSFDSRDEHAREVWYANIRGIGAKDQVARNVTGAVSSFVDSLLKKEGVEIAEGAPERATLGRLLLRAFAELRKLELARLGGDYSVTPSDPVFASPPAGEARPTPAPSVTSAAPLASKLIAEFAAHRRREGRVKAKTEDLDEAARKRFIEWCGDRPIDQYRKLDLSEFADAYSRFPADHRHKPAAYRAMPMKEIVADAERRKAKPVAPATVQRNYSAVSSFFEWCVRKGLVDNNPCEGVLDLKKTTRARDRRAAWTVDDLNELFGTPAWVGYERDTRRDLPGTVRKRDWFFWLPPLMLFTGMRLGEAASLFLSEVKHEGEVAYFDLQVREDRSLKTMAGERRIPVHPELVALGFLDYVAGLRRAGEVQVFPSLKPGGKYKEWSFTPTKGINKYLKALGMKRDGRKLDNHGFRHNFVTALAVAGVSSEVALELRGHEQKGMSAVYIKGLPITVLADAIAKVAYPGLDLAHLYPGSTLRRRRGDPA
jgi:integrase